MASLALPVDYQHLFRTLPENFLLIGPDPAATILDNTDSHVGVSLKSRASVVGKPFFEAYPATDESGAAEIRKSHQHVREHLTPHTMPLIRYDLVGPDGQLEELYWQATHYPVLDEQGQLRYILQRTQDVTAQLRASQAADEARRRLAEEQQRTRFILESLPVLVWTATASGQRDYFNARWLAFTGQPLGSQLHEGWLESLHPDDRAHVRQQWQASIAQGTPYQVEYRLRRADGQYRWMLSRATPQRSAADEITMWVGGVVDVHDQKRLVEEILEANEQQAVLSDQAYQNFKLVQQQRQLFYNLLLHAPAHICIVRGPEHRYEFANEEFLAFTQGVPVIGRTVAEVYPETVSQGLIAVLDRVLQTKEPYRGYERPLYLYDREGQLQEHFFNVLYDCFEEDGQPAGVTGYALDVTELVRARQQLQALLPPAAEAAS
ncbi:PAS domain-containing protein [Hymenobacter sp. RP-2-7]|uniref:histidine kinase n=1 Tax=Hymenobacter polaris TaxID=2682546 RepID=A0A7Y0ACT7_9BACT|nr:PAS domain-containing protein [Hymenobacter polaris]NML64987.1 PAS domain-containing protein [Hymenobacter polaris]